MNNQDQGAGNRAGNEGPAMNGLRVGHININSALHKMDTIKFFLEHYGFDVFIVSEAKMVGKEQRLYRINGYRKWYLNRDDNGYGPKGGGMLIYVSKEIYDDIVVDEDDNSREAYYYDTRKGVQCMWLRMRHNQATLYIVGVYIPPTRSGEGLKKFTRNQRVEELIKCLEQFPKDDNVIILGDTNFHYLKQQVSGYPAARIQNLGYNQLID